MKRRAFTVWYDPENGEMLTRDESAYFQAESPLMRADVLKDAVYATTVAYATSVSAAFDFKRAKRGKAPLDTMTEMRASLTR